MNYSVSIYKPNASNAGCAASFTFDPKKGIYLNMVKQVSWDSASKKASFKSEDPSKKIAIKFNAFELGGICHTILTGNEFSTVHVFNENKTSISFKPYEKKNGAKAFGLSVSKGEQKFLISFEQSEAYVIKTFCDRVILESLAQQERE